MFDIFCNFCSSRFCVMSFSAVRIFKMSTSSVIDSSLLPCCPCIVLILSIRSYATVISLCITTIASWTLLKFGQDVVQEIRKQTSLLAEYTLKMKTRIDSNFSNVHDAIVVIQREITVAYERIDSINTILNATYSVVLNHWHHFLLKLFLP
jgi:hypothetical protein